MSDKREAALNAITQQIMELNKIWEDFQSHGKLQYSWEKIKRWVDRTDGIISNHVNPKEGAKFKEASGGIAMGDGYGNFQREVQAKDAFLRSLLEEVSLYPQAVLKGQANSLQDKKPNQVKQSSNDIFIVHGHDDGIKNTIARFIEKLDLHPIILHEQPNKGMTIIEKFENHAPVSFAIILLTPDDVGASVEEKDKLSPRARQNVVFELGFFIGSLKRQRVVVLYKKEVEIPSDFNGILYIPYDESGGWKLLLARELKSAGFNVDLNKAI